MGGWMRRFKVMAQTSRAWDQGCRRQVKILSGDNARVTQHVGSELGIAINGALIGTEIENRQGTIGQRITPMVEKVHALTDRSLARDHRAGG